VITVCIFLTRPYYQANQPRGCDITTFDEDRVTNRCDWQEFLEKQALIDKDDPDAPFAEMEAIYDLLSLCDRNGGFVADRFC